MGGLRETKDMRVNLDRRKKNNRLKSKFVMDMFTPAHLMVFLHVCQFIYMKFTLALELIDIVGVI